MLEVTRSQPLKLLKLPDAVRMVLYLRHYSLLTERSYVAWIVRICSTLWYGAWLVPIKGQGKNRATCYLAAFSRNMLYTSPIKEDI